MATEELEEGGSGAEELRVGVGESEDALESVDVRVVVAARTWLGKLGQPEWSEGRTGGCKLWSRRRASRRQGLPASEARISLAPSRKVKTHRLLVPNVGAVCKDTKHERVPRILRPHRFARSTEGFAVSLAMSSPSSLPACDVRTERVRSAKKEEVGCGRRVVR